MKGKNLKNNKSLEYRLFPYLMVLPNFLVFLVFIIIPFFYGTIISFADWKGIGKINFIGLGKLYFGIEGKISAEELYGLIENEKCGREYIMSAAGMKLIWRLGVRL